MLLRILVILLLTQAIGWLLMSQLPIVDGVMLIVSVTMITTTLAMLGLWFGLIKPYREGMESLRKAFLSPSEMTTFSVETLPIGLRDFAYEIQKRLRALKKDTETVKTDLSALHERVLCLTLPVMIIDAEQKVVAMNPPAAQQFPELSLGNILPEQAEKLQQNIWRIPWSTKAGNDAELLIALPKQTNVDTEKLLADLSHELRTPMTSVRGFIEILHTKKLGAAEQKKILVTLQKQTERMEHLLSDMLLLSQLEHQQYPNDQIVDLTQIIPQEINALSQQAEKRGMNIVTELPEEALVLGNEPRLSGMVSNLLHNAIKYGAKKSTITLGLTRATPQALAMEFPELDRVPDQEHYWCFSVQDQGQGIAPQHLAHLHKRFYRVDRHRSSDAGGVGLGLSIVDQVLASHRGFFVLRSRLGEGSRFVAILPVLSEE